MTDKTVEDYNLSVTDAAALLGISRQAVFNLIKRERLAYVVEKGDFGTIQYKLSAASVSAWASRKDDEISRKLLSGKEATNQPGNQSTKQASNPSSNAAPPESGRVLDRLRSEAARWKGKYEATREAFASEHKERERAEERVNQLAFELGGAKKQVEFLEARFKQLQSGIERSGDRPANSEGSGESRG